MQHKFLTPGGGHGGCLGVGLPALAAGGAGSMAPCRARTPFCTLRSGSADAAYTCMVGNTPVTPAKATPLSGWTPGPHRHSAGQLCRHLESQRDTIHDIFKRPG